MVMSQEKLELWGKLVREHHTKRPVLCPVCNVSLASLSEIRTHYMQDHFKDWTPADPNQSPPSLGISVSDSANAGDRVG